ncbi:tRNA N(3)-methylcytidine methyltransferase METTL2 isoform X1 [Periplaneta americana]|uniref:tRNA N(3)-methylcytidine methyltransferase METTL2 isoform X1 n=1 Tax=Periplaneta americana TaxID=6978 RepID=UPI0037E833F6
MADEGKQNAEQDGIAGTRPQFGNRYLKNGDNIFKHNAWDNVQWDAAQEELAQCKVLQNSSVLASQAERDQYESGASSYWDAFYGVHHNRFFKDRHWLFTEFPELAPQQRSRVLEIGCGVGNTVFPILQYSADPELLVYCCDFSPAAIEILKENPEYDSKRCVAFVCDVTDDDWQAPFPPNSLDIAVMIFVLSAINPDRMAHVLRKVFQYLRPGGLLLFRDYGRYDMAQLRFKKGRCLSDNFYVRGDGTRVYFFTQDEVKDLFSTAGFEEIQNLVDRRLQVNRGKLLTMYRVWIQAKYRKPPVDTA